MRQYKVLYKDEKIGRQGEQYETKVYPERNARNIADALELMGCSEVVLVLA